MINLTDAQKESVKRWLADGSKMSEVQKRLETEFGLRPTYMEVRLLVSDLEVLPKDPEPVKPVELPTAPKPAPAAPASPSGSMPAPPDEEDLGEPDAAMEPEGAPGLGGQVSVTMDHIAIPGTMMSGKVTFSDGQSGQWYLDQSGRLGLGMAQKGYRPSPADIQQFQMALEREARKMGL